MRNLGFVNATIVGYTNTGVLAGINNSTAVSNVYSATTALLAGLAVRIKKNTALSNFEFEMVDATDGFTSETGLAVTATRSIDGAAYAPCANVASEVGNGTYRINLAATDLNGDVITFRFTGSGARDTKVTVVTQP